MCLGGRPISPLCMRSVQYLYYVAGSCVYSKKMVLIKIREEDSTFKRQTNPILDDGRYIFVLFLHFLPSIIKNIFE